MITLATHLKRLYRKHFRSYLRHKGGHPSRRHSDRLLGSPKYKRSILLLFSTQLKVTLRSNQTQCHHITIITQSNLYEVNSSRHYKCKGLFTEEFQSILELQNHQIPKVKTGLANHCNNNWRHLSNSGQSTTSFSTTIGNNKHENSLKGSCHLRPSLNTTQMCESAFKLRTTIDHTGRVCNTLNPKLLIKHTNSDNLKTIVNELFQVSIDRRCKYRVKRDR